MYELKMWDATLAKCVLHLLTHTNNGATTVQIGQHRLWTLAFKPVNKGMLQWFNACCSQSIKQLLGSKTTIRQHNTELLSSIRTLLTNK